MGFLGHFYTPWGIILLAIAIIHFIRRRPDTWWLYVILFLGWPGAAIYIVAEVLPDFSLVGKGFKMFPRRKRIKALRALVQQNGAPGNYEELGDLLMEDGKLAEAREAFDRSVAARGDSLDVFYRRGACALALGDAAVAVPDLERVYAKEPGYDFHRAAGLLADAYAKTGDAVRAEAMFRRVTAVSVASETYLNYAELLASEGRKDEARAWAQKVLEKKVGMTGFQKRRERPWFRRAGAMVKRLA